MINRSIIILIIGLVITTSCNNNSFNVTESGLEYRFIVQDASNIQPQQGDIVSLNLRYANLDGATIEEKTNYRTQLSKSTHVGGSIEDAIMLMHKGDSIIFKINANDYYTKTLNVKLPGSLLLDDELIFYVGLADVTSFDEFTKQRTTTRLSDDVGEDKLLSDFLKRTNVQVEPTMSGLYFIEIKKGQGDSPVPLKKVKVHYLGYFIDGKVFDSSYDRGKPIEFKYGAGEVIQGWDEGLTKMSAGGKYKLIIPSYLAYGDVKRGPIPPNSTLIFEMELLEVER